MLHPGTVDTDLSQPFQKVQTALSFSTSCALPLLICNSGEDLALQLCLLNGRGVFPPVASCKPLAMQLGWLHRLRLSDHSL